MFAMPASAYDGENPTTEAETQETISARELLSYKMSNWHRDDGPLGRFLQLREAEELRANSDREADEVLRAINDREADELWEVGWVEKILRDCVGTWTEYRRCAAAQRWRQ